MTEAGRESVEGRLVVMVGSVVNVICQHKAEMGIHVKKLIVPGKTSA